MSHNLPDEIGRIEKAALLQGVKDLAPGQELTIDLEQSDIYIHLAGQGVNILSLTVQRPVDKPKT